MSTRLQNLSIDHFRGADDDSDQVALNALLQHINAILQLENNRDRNVVSRISFLREAGYGTDWGMRATARLPPGHSYQQLENSLKRSQKEVRKSKYAADQTNSREHEG